MPTTCPVRSSTEVIVGVRRGVHHQALARLEVRIGEPGHRAALRGDGRAGDHRVVGAGDESVEDAVEVVPLELHHLVLDAEDAAERVYELDVEAGGAATLHQLERRVGERRRDRERAQLCER